eukprot:10972696-Heterocapsa_arctica.AAC.1
MVSSFFLGSPISIAQFFSSSYGGMTLSIVSSSQFFPSSPPTSARTLQQSAARCPGVPHA